MPIDLKLLDDEETLAMVKKSQEARFPGEGLADLVDRVVALRKAWKAAENDRNRLNQQKNKSAKTMGAHMKSRPKKTKGKELTDEEKAAAAEFDAKAAALREEGKRLSQEAAAAEKTALAMEAEMHKLGNRIGNLVHSSVPVSNDEEKDSETVSTWGNPRKPKDGEELLHHHELLEMVDGFNPYVARELAGHRAYFLKGVGVMLNLALQSFGLFYLQRHAYTPLLPPFFMKRDAMAKTAQLEDFDEELYHVSTKSSTDAPAAAAAAAAAAADGEEKKEDPKKGKKKKNNKGGKGKQENDEGDDDMYLIATSEQPISGFHRGQLLSDHDLPLRYAGVSTCFRKEAGKSGAEVQGIFRVHQFEKIEQFCLTAPGDSWAEHERMLKIAEGFYQALGIPYRVINIVSGELNNAAAKKYDLEGWFPTRQVYRELVSASNCTSYQSRAMQTAYQTAHKHEGGFVHMLNATLCATERTICCILENYQTPDGVRIPEVLQPFMGGMEFVKFTRPRPENKTAKKQQKSKSKKQQKSKK